MNNHTSQLLYISTAIAAAILCALCLALPVFQWASIAQNPTVKASAIAAAFAVGICKLVFFPLSAECLKNKQPLAAAVLLCLALLSLWLSVGASADLLNNVTAEKQQQKNTGTRDYQQAQTELNDLNQEIKNFHLVMAKDAVSKFSNARERAHQGAEKLEYLRELRRAKKHEMNSRQRGDFSGQRWTFGKKISLSLGSYSLELGAAYISAAILHILCVFSLLAITSWWPLPARAHVNAHTQQQAVTAKVTNTQKVTAKEITNTQARTGNAKDNTKKQTAIKTMEGNNATEISNVIDQPEKTTSETPIEPGAFSEEQERIYNRVVMGLYGNTPAIRNVISDSEVKGGYHTVKAVFNKLLADDHIRQAGRGYELVKLNN